MPSGTPCPASVLASAGFDCGALFQTLARRVACRTESQNPGRAAELRAYLADELAPALLALGFEVALADIQVGGDPADPAVDAGWGEPGLTPADQVFGWNTLEVLAYGCGNPAQPVSAVPPATHDSLQLRFVVGTDEHVLPALTREGLAMTAALLWAVGEQAGSLPRLSR